MTVTGLTGTDMFNQGMTDRKGDAGPSTLKRRERRKELGKETLGNWEI